MKKILLKKSISFVLVICLIMQVLSGIVTVYASDATKEITMKYYSGGSWKNFSDGVARADGISGIRLNTPSGSSYYLRYRTLNNYANGYFDYVNSNVNDFAGTTKNDAATGNVRTIKQIQIQVCQTDGTKITAGIVVMYRVMINGAWLSWTSNADPEWMQSVKTKYNLPGTLDTRGSFAGKDEEIQAVEIHVYEEADIVAGSGVFSGDETSAGFRVMSHGSSVWSGYTKSALCEMDCVQIRSDTSKSYYLRYQTLNEGGSSFYSMVSSRDTDKYAGVSGKAIQALRIQAYTYDGTKLTAGIVVMYRTRVGTEWLPWVSNADPEYMQSIKAQYGLNGTLDTHGSYAGKIGNNITGLEIRVFEGEIPSTAVNGLSGAEYTPQMFFLKNDTVNWNGFSGSTTGSQNQIAGLKIQTAGKDYYLSYRVSTVSGGFLPTVKSNENDWAGRTVCTPIDRVAIQVFNSAGVKQVRNVIVMYRAYSNGAWLPWVSNADAEWMQSVLMKYHLDGTLDTKSGNAGIAGKQITNLEIRIFEEKSLTTVSKPVGKYKIIQTPYIYQNIKYPTGCESVSTVMALQYSGVNISVETFINNYLPKTSNTHNFNPNTSFGGNPYGYGLGCYAPVIKTACDRLLSGKPQYATELHGKTLEYLCSEYIDRNIPVILWATTDMKAPYISKYLEDGTPWITPEHCLLLVGYDDYNYIFKDPQVNRPLTYYSKSQVKIAYEGLGSQAVVIRKNSTNITTPPTIPTAPTVKPSSPSQEYVKPNPVKESHCADPIDLNTGSHVITNNLISLFGGRQTTVTANYNSSQLTEGAMGVGWSYNFEKTLSVSENGILIYDTPSVYSRYNPTDKGNEYTCATKGKNGYVITRSDDGYELNCNHKKTERYDLSGRLVSITDAQGFVTTIGYSNNLITVTDTLSGKHIYLEKDVGKVSRIYDDDSREVILTYCNGYLSLIKDVNGNYLTYKYNADGRMESGTDGEGTVYFTNEYDSSGRIVKQYDGVPNETNSENNFTSFLYGDNGSVTVTDRNGNVSTRVFNDDGQLIRYTDENGNTTAYAYDENLNLVSSTDALGHSETALYNSLNLPVLRTDKNGVKTKTAYDDNGNVIRVIYNEKGDANDDSDVDIKDLLRIKRYIADNSAPINLSAADINSDGEYNSDDLVELRKYLLGADTQNIACELYRYNERNQAVSHTDLRGTETVYTYDENGMPQSQYTNGRTVSYHYVGGLMMSQTDARGNTTSYTYNGIGQMQTSTDPENNVSSYNYDAAGNLLELIGANGDSLSYSYDGNNLKTSYTDGNGNTTFYSYNGNMKLQSVTTPDSVSAAYTYDGEDRLVSVTDQNGRVTAMAYDAAGRVVRKSDGEKNTTEYEYDAVGNVVKQIAPNGSITENTYDAVGNLLTVKDASGNLTSYRYNAFSKTVQIENAENGISKNVYNVAGDLLCSVNAQNQSVKYAYDAFGNKISVTDANGSVTKYSYDANNNLVSVTDALGNKTTNVYDCNNRLVETNDALGNKTFYGYDVLGRQISETDANGHTSRKSYDANGNVLSVTDAKGNIQQTALYDQNNNAVSVTDAAGNTVTNQYDRAGNLTVTADALGNEQSYTYDGNNRMTAAVNKDGKTSGVGYDENGNITRVTDPLGGSTVYTYDSANRLTSESTASDGTVTYNYNALNLKSQLTNARGQVTSFSYDAVGRITGYTNAEGSAVYTYDNNGNVLTVTDRNGTVAREYDALNRVTKYTDTLGNTIGYEYDAVGNITKTVYPDNTAVVYAYDACGNLVSVTDWADRTTTYSYDENNNVTGITKPDGSTTVTVYDNSQRVISTVERSSSGTVIAGYEYSYDNLGRILSEIHLAENVKYEYTYDILSRVTKRICTNLSDNTATEETYAYDDAGNIISCTVNCGCDSFVYDRNNRLISYNGQAVTYDADGNMLSALLNGTEMQFAYDSANRLISAGGNSYTYNAENVRVRNLCGESETTYAYNTNGRLSRLLVKTTDGVITKYVYGLGLIGEETSDSFKTYHFDYRGSTAAITDINGNVTDTFEYDTYGNLVSRTGTSAVIFLYNGRDGVVTDDNGLLYMRARYYSPELRRFTNADIIAGEISNAVTLNRYAYANGNPVSNIDPFGLSAERGNQTIYSGSIWNDSFKPDMLYADISIIQLMKILSPLSSVKSEKQHLDTWKRLVKLLTNEKMQPILMDMIEHFCTGKGSDYSNAQLTNAVKYHTVTQDYMKDFSDVFKTYMSKYNGDYTAFAQSDNFRDDLKANGVLISKYSYGGGLFDEDTWGGLTMAIHGWTENRVDITDSFIIGNKYYTNLQFTFIDNFGLDRDDLREFGIIPGFESWYALQHNKNYQGKYQPFKTVVTIDYKVVGWL